MLKNPVFTRALIFFDCFRVLFSGSWQSAFCAIKLQIFTSTLLSCSVRIWSYSWFSSPYQLFIPNHLPDFALPVQLSIQTTESLQNKVGWKEIKKENHTIADVVSNLSILALFCLPIFVLLKNCSWSWWSSVGCKRDWRIWRISRK